MDPVSVLTVVKVVTAATAQLISLKSRYRNVPLQVSTLIGQLHIVQAALEQISAWTSKDLLSSPRYQHLAAQIEGSLDCFCPLILALQQHLDSLGSPDQSGMTARSKMSFLWNEQDLVSYSNLLDRQANALNLFLQAVQCQTLAEQQRIIDNEESQTILQEARDCSSSIMGLSDDGTSILSESTNINSVSLEFDFDAVLLESRAYRSAHRSNLKQIIFSNVNPPQYSSTSLPDIRHRPTSLLANPQKAFSWISIDLEPYDLKKQNNDKSGMGNSQNSVLLHRASMIGNSQVGEGQSRRVKKTTPGLALQNARVPGQAQPALESDGSKLEKSSATRNGASVVAGHGGLTVPFKAAPAPGGILLRSLKKAWGILPTNQALHTEAADISRSQHVSPITTGRGRKQTKAKLLILGTSESGKSTLLQGMRPISRDLSNEWLPVILENIVAGIRIILAAMEDQEITLQDKIKCHTRIIMDEDISHIFSHTTEIQTSITQLWADRGFKEAYSKCRFEDGVDDNLHYFIDHIGRLAASGYIPTHEDILRARIRTVGITESTIYKGGVEFSVFDVGGTRCERRKWIHTFEDVGTLVFTVDASAYARVLLEDQHTIMMSEQLQIWESIANSRWFSAAKLVLVFTKIDLLPEVLRLRPPTTFFPNFKEPDAGDTALLVDSYLEFLVEQFTSLIRDEDFRRRVTVICADLVHFDGHTPADAVLDAALR